MGTKGNDWVVSKAKLLALLKKNRGEFEAKILAKREEERKDRIEHVKASIANYQKELAELRKTKSEIRTGYIWDDSARKLDRYDSAIRRMELEERDEVTINVSWADFAGLL
jgi:hypothetical protein